MMEVVNLVIIIYALAALKYWDTDEIFNVSYFVCVRACVQCVPQVDAEVLTALIPKLIELLKSGVGLGTKVATAQFIISLVRQCMFDLTPYTGRCNSCTVCV